MKKATVAFGAGLFSLLASGALAGSASAERRPGGIIGMFSAL